MIHRFSSHLPGVKPLVECNRTLRTEKVEPLPSQALSASGWKRSWARRASAPARQVARRFHLPESTVRAIDLRYLERWAAGRRKPPLRQMGLDEIPLGKEQKLLSWVYHWETAAPLGFGREPNNEIRDEFCEVEGSVQQRRGLAPVWICGSPSG